MSFQRHDSQGKLKEHLQQVGFVWSYAHEDLLPGELSQQQVLLKSKIPTLDQLVQIDKEIEIQKSKLEKNKVALEQRNPIMIKDCEEGSSSSSMSMHNLDSNGDDLYFPSNQSPIVVIHDAPLLMHLEEVHSSPITEKVSSEMHSVIQEEDHPSTYNIEEIFHAFTFNLCRKEVNWKRVQKVKQSDGTLEEM